MGFDFKEAAYGAVAAVFLIITYQVLKSALKKTTDGVKTGLDKGNEIMDKKLATKKDENEKDESK